MANEDQKPKPKMLTEDEHKERLVKEIDRLRSVPLRHSIEHGWESHGNRLSPEVTIKLRGGDTNEVHQLALQIEQTILDFAKIKANIASE